MIKPTRSISATSTLQSPPQSFQALFQRCKQGKLIFEDSIASLSREIFASENLPLNRKIHSITIGCGFGTVSYLCDPIIRAFASCGSLIEACLVFCSISEPSVYTWQAIIFAHLQQEENVLALLLYKHMQHLGTHPNRFVFTSGLKACTAVGDISQGKGIHTDIIKSGLESDQFIECALVDMYMKCGDIDEAMEIFYLSKTRDNVLWTAIIAGYVQQGFGDKALRFFYNMQEVGECPNLFTFSCALKACSNVGGFAQGTRLHMEIVKCGLESDTVIGNALISMYTDSNHLGDARHVFDRLPKKSITSWGAMLAGHAQQANDLSALQLIEDMQAASIRPNRAVFLYSMKACSSMSAIMEGMHLHDQVLRSSLDSETGIVNVIVDIYSKCGCLREAHQVHNSLSKPSVVSWGTLVYGYIQSGRCCIALELLKTYQREAFLLDKVLYLCSMKAARSIGEIKCIKMLHVQVIHDELVSGEETVTNALLDAYVKCGDMDNAHQIFEHRGRGNLISCSSMIGGYAELGHGVKALKLYNDMRAKGVKVDKAFCLSVIKACSALGALDQAKEIHDHLIQSGIDVDTEIGNSLVHMYAKCGVLLEAGIVLDRLPIKDEFSWCAMIAGYASSGDSSHMKQCLADMHLHGVKPNDAIYCSLLSACSHVGAVIEGIQFLDAMREHRVQPNIEHFTSIIDLLCRAGLIDEAKKLFFAAYGLPGSIEWTSVLSACRSYGIMCISSSHKDHGSNASCSLYNDFCTYSEQETNYLGNFIHQIHTLKDSPKYTKESCYRGLSVLM